MAQPLADRVTVVAVPVLAHARTLLNTRSRSEFETTKTLENAIAAAATMPAAHAADGVGDLHAGDYTPAGYQESSTLRRVRSGALRIPVTIS